MPTPTTTSIEVLDTLTAYLATETGTPTDDFTAYEHLECVALDLLAMVEDAARRCTPYRWKDADAA